MFFFLTFISISSHAQDVAELMRKVDVLSQTVNSALDKTDNILSSQQRTFFMNLANYASYLNGHLKELGSELDRNLTKKELALLNDVNAALAKAKDTSAQWSDKVESLATIIESAPIRIFGSDKYPTPSFYKMPLLTNVQNKNINIDIKGVRLNSEKNYIEFAGKKIPVTSIASDKQISFTVPLTSADLFDSNAVNTFKVVLHEERWWGLLDDKQHVYTPRFLVTPKDIASIKVYYKVPKKRKEVSGTLSDIVHATSGSGSTKDVEKTFNIRNSASDGWKLKRDSILCWKSSGNGDKHGYAGPYKNSITDISFKAKAYAKRGKATCKCTWKEFRIINEEETKMSTISLAFDSQKVTALPNNIIGLAKVVVTYYDGTTYETADTYFKRKHVEFNFNLLSNLYEVKFST